MYQQDSPAEVRDSSIISGQSSPNHRIWKDTSAEERFGNYLDNAGGDMQLRPTMANRPTVAGMAAAPHADIAVGTLDDDAAVKSKTYKGRKRVWPGALFLLIMTLGAFAAIAWFGKEQYDAAQKQQAVSEEFTAPRTPRKVLPLKVCRVPNYVTDKGKLYAIGGDEKHEVHFTGINWSGMENVEGVPHGIAPRQSDLDTIAKRLHEMEINAVRLPLNAKMIIEDTPPDVTRFVARSQADVYGVSTYMDMIKKVVQGLARQQIAVLLDLHKIDPAYNESTSEELWYTDEFPETAIIDMFKKLATSLCNEQHYNIIGIDIKNEPVKGCWPAKDTDSYCPRERNWPRAVERIGAEILKICPNWLLVVEGLYATNIVSEFNGQNYTYNDWYGASFQNATKNPIKLKPENKIVFAPHFYSPSVYPSSYFFAKQASAADSSVTVEEYPDTADGNAKLQAAVTTVLDNAFGEVLTKGTVPVFYGEFGGIYGAKELLKGKTSTRVIDLLIQYADKRGMIGGFSWALNPDGNYDFNDKYIGYMKGSASYKPWMFGLYADEKWDKFNEDYAAGLRKLKGNGIIPCFSRIVGTKEVDGSGSGSPAATIAPPKATPKPAT
ncbi:hypothetical protein PINS_up018615 [Pythium insidiosum]|nr:hypothetical protein PINS_up018615 [Pythium insidiosum]